MPRKLCPILRASPDAVTADIEFLAIGPGRPFSYGHEPREPPPSAEFTARRVPIRDARGTQPLSLEANGAAPLTASTTDRSIDDDGKLLGRDYPEAAEIISAALGAGRARAHGPQVPSTRWLRIQPVLR